MTEAERVLVAMSGGVDSSVAALLLREAGKDVLGVSMQVWDYAQNGGAKSRASCCSPDDFCDARRVAHKLGVPYYVFDFENRFREEVIDPFVEAYNNGLTPNPCVECNSRIKFGELRKRAKALGASAVATGHYARIEKREDGYHLLRSKDLDKDQTYFLYRLTQQELATTLFPIGQYKKDEVRDLARQAGLVTADKAESQDICFVSGSVQDFVSKIGSRKSGAGTITLKDGQTIGSHDGVRNFTVGQRKGLGIGGTTEPLYVLKLDAKENKVVVGAKADLEQSGFRAVDCSWVAPCVISKGSQLPLRLNAIAQLRHRHSGVRVQLEIDCREQARAYFESEWGVVSPGQAVVFYDLSNVEVLGGGTIQALDP